ncbi:MAG: helix-turn-helix domain-containing protein [candidate division WOR-3 bacterium]
MHEPEFLTVEEVAELLRVSTRTVQRLLKEGGLPGVRIGRQWRIPRAELLAHLKVPTRAFAEGRRERGTDQ